MVTALILSGGTGSRLGGSIPKQYMAAGDKPVISYCINTLSVSEQIGAIWIVASAEWQEFIRTCLNEADCNNKFKGFSNPGVNRQLSIYNGLKGIKDGLPDTGSVLVHDAARPMLSLADIESCVAAAAGHDGVIPVIPMKDTVYLSSNGESITGLLNRSHVFAGQAPELFALDKYIAANESLINWHIKNAQGEMEILPSSAIFKINGSTEPAIMAGMDIAMIPGNEGNFKITTREDFERFVHIVGRK